MIRSLTPTAVAAAACLLTPLAHADGLKTDGLWRGTGGAALSATSGNTTGASLLVNVDTSRATEADKISLGGAINYASNTTDGESQTTSNKWNAAGEYDYNLSPALFAFGKLGLERDQITHLSLRTAVAGGLGYKLINTQELTFTLFGGAGYTVDKYSVEQTVNDSVDTRFSRTSVYLGEESTHQFSPTVSFRQRLDVYPALGGDNAVLAKFNAGLSVAMNSTLSLTVGLIDTYNSKPPTGFKSNDVGLFTGINVKFGAQ